MTHENITYVARRYVDVRITTLAYKACIQIRASKYNISAQQINGKYKIKYVGNKYKLFMAPNLLMQCSSHIKIMI